MANKFNLKSLKRKGLIALSLLMTSVSSSALNLGTPSSPKSTQSSKEDIRKELGINPDNSACVSQDIMGYIKRGDGPKHVLGTIGVGPCVGLIAYNSESGEAIVAHFANPEMMLPAINPFLWTLNKNKHPIDIYLFSKNKDSLQSVKEDLEKNTPNIKKSFIKDISNTIDPKNKYSSLQAAIDVNTGKIFTNKRLSDCFNLPEIDGRHLIFKNINYILASSMGETRDLQFERIFPNGNFYEKQRESTAPNKPKGMNP